MFDMIPAAISLVAFATLALWGARHVAHHDSIVRVRDVSSDELGWIPSHRDRELLLNASRRPVNPSR